MPTFLSAGGRGWFKIGKNSVKNQSKALIPQNKNENFQKFLTYFPKTSYERRATRNGYIFVSKAQVALIIEALALEFTQSLSPRAPLDSQQGNVSSLAFEFTLGVCLLAFLPGVGGGSKTYPFSPS